MYDERPQRTCFSANRLTPLPSPPLHSCDAFLANSSCRCGDGSSPGEGVREVEETAVRLLFPGCLTCVGRRCVYGVTTRGGGRRKRPDISNAQDTASNLRRRKTETFFVVFWSGVSLHFWSLRSSTPVFPSACGPLAPHCVQKLSRAQRSMLLSCLPCCRLAPPSPRDRSVDSNARRARCRRWWCGRQGFRRRFLAWGYHPRQESSSSAPRVRTTLSAHKGMGCGETKRGSLTSTTKLKKGKSVVGKIMRGKLGAFFSA